MWVFPEHPEVCTTWHWWQEILQGDLADWVCLPRYQIWPAKRQDLRQMAHLCCGINDWYEGKKSIWYILAKTKWPSLVRWHYQIVFSLTKNTVFWVKFHWITWSMFITVTQGSTLSFLAGCPKSHFLGWYRNVLVYWYLRLDNQVVNPTCPKDKLDWIWPADDP